MVSQYLTHVLKYILKLREQCVVVVERLENTAEDFQLKMTGWTCMLLPGTPLKWQQKDLINIFKATRTKRTDRRCQQQHFVSWEQKAHLSQDFRKLRLTPVDQHKQLGLHWDPPPPKARALLEIGGLKAKSS